MESAPAPPTSPKAPKKPRKKREPKKPTPKFNITFGPVVLSFD